MYHFQLELDSHVTMQNVCTYITRLKKLKEFSFFGHGYEYAVKLSNLIIKSLPTIHSVTGGDKFIFYDQNNVKVGDVFQLNELFTQGMLPPAVSFPNLQTLHLIGPLTSSGPFFLYPFACYSKLRYLDLRNLATPLIYRILNATGLQLSKLLIDEARDQIDVLKLFSFCPNLEMLRVYTSYVTPITSASLSNVSSHNFRQLKIFNVNFRSESVNLELLKYLFEAPLIEEIYFCDAQLNPCELMKIVKDLDGTKLQHLQEIYFNHFVCDTPDEDESLAVLVKSIVAKAVGLGHLAISCDKDDELIGLERKDVEYFVALFQHLRCSAYGSIKEN
jgi:hypothetical protein